MLEVEQARLMAKSRVIGGRQMPGGVRREPQRQRHGRMREQPNDRARPRRAARPAGTPSTTSAGAHSAKTTFWSRCALSSDVVASESRGVTTAASTSSRPPPKHASRQRGTTSPRTPIAYDARERAEDEES